MAEETRTATIQVRQVKSGPQAFIEIPTKKGGAQEQVLTEGKLSKRLAEAFLQSIKVLEGIAVEFEVQNGLLQRVWEAGKAWDRETGPVATSPKSSSHPQSGGHGGSGGQKKSGGSSHYGQQSYQPPPSLHTGPNHFFENPYNFIPAPPRERGHTSLGDSEPCGHHRYHPGLWSGRIGVTLTTCTPLLIPDLGTQGEHKIFGLRVDKQGVPYLPPTSFKGVLRNAYEAVTGSRMGILEPHNDRLALRMPAPEALVLVPCRIVAGTAGSLTAQLLPGHSVIGLGGKPDGQGPACLMYAAWLRRYRKYHKNYANHHRDKHEAVEAKKYGSGALPRHGDHVWVSSSQITHSSGKFSYLSVQEIRPATPGAAYPTGWDEGYVYVSGPNIMNKHDERVFLVTTKAVSLPISDDQVRAWRRLLLDYRSVHEKELNDRRQHSQRPEHYLGHEPGKTGFSRHVFAAGSENLQAGDLCYARIETDAHGKPISLVDLFPVTITRMLYQEPPIARLDPGQLPPKDWAELSPADRVFGWVNQDGHGSYKGQLRVSTITCLDGKAAIEPLGGQDGQPLAILGQPKPAQARFYAARTPAGEPLTRDPQHKRDEKKEGYAPGTGLRGRKVYPHQRQAESADYWNTATEGADLLPAPFNNRTVYREWQANGNEAADQHRSITAWVKPGTRFRLDLDVVNLSDQELGALLWLLSLKDGYFRLGGGKPLGFGSARVEIAGLDLATGKALSAEYRAFGQTESATGPRIRTLEEAATVIDAYQKALPGVLGEPGKQFANLSVIKAFLNATKGGALPVHYPRTDQQSRPSGESYKWFVQNEKSDSKRHERFSLPALQDTNRGLPELKET